jgi:hypothetical protein
MEGMVERLCKARSRRSKERMWNTHGTRFQIVGNQTFKTEDPLEIGKILGDLYTGDKYKILAIAETQGQNEASHSANVASRKVHRRGIAPLLKDGGYSLAVECKPFTAVRWARTAR